MPAVLNEQTQYVDSAGKPLANGKVYFGIQNADPTAGGITIFSDRELTTPIANPQILDEFGRTTNKVWVASRYSLRVDDLNDAQKYQELDNGETPDVGVTALENVSGANTIVAEATSSIASYKDLEQYTFIAAANNAAGGVTLNIDSVGQTSVVKDYNKPIQKDDFEAGQVVIVARNETDDTFEWTNQNLKSPASYKGTDIADSAAPTLPTDGDYFEALGTTTRTSYVVEANRSWVEKTIGARTYTASASIVTADGSDLILAAGELVLFQSTAANVVQVVTGAAGAVDVQTFTSSGTWNKPSSGTIVLIETWGAGASGGASTVNAGGGGGGGGYSSVMVLLSILGSSETVTIGAGGVVQTGVGNGTAGGTTTFGAHLSAYGGGYGTADGGGNGSGGGGGGSLSAGADAVTTTGGNGGGPSFGDGGTSANDGEHGAGGGGGGGNNATRGGDGYHGGGGGGGEGPSGNGGNGGDSHDGGGGGGGGSDVSTSGVGGTSINGGSGGAGAFSTNNATAGTQPSGGGGGSRSGDSGAGADGQVKVTVW